MFGWVSARYESAYQKWGERSWIPASLQDARRDYDASTRRELQRRSRYWERNNGICQRIADVFVQFTVGPNGIMMIPDSSNEEFNLAAADVWDANTQQLDMLSKDECGLVQQTMARSLFFDGEVFIYKVKDGFRPRIQLIEAHRIETPPSMMDEENKTIVDGIAIDPQGRPTAYWVKDQTNTANPSLFGAPDQIQNFTQIPASLIIHRFIRKRPGQYRGIPFLYPVMNDLHDLDDLQMYEMRAAKDAAIISNVITNASGEKDPATLRRAKSQILSQNANQMPVVKQDDQFYDVVFGSKTVMLKVGETMEQFRSSRPSVTTREYWDYLLAKICAGVGVARLLVFPFSIQGTVTRADLDISAGIFRSKSKIIASLMREVYAWIMGYEIQYGKLDGAPTDGTQLDVRCVPPRSPNVDVGRNSAALLQELEAGARTFQDVYAELGEDWRYQLRQKAKERAYIHQLAKEYSTNESPIDPNEIAATTIPPGNGNENEQDQKGGNTAPAETATP